MDEDIVIPANPTFYKRYVDDTYVRRKKHETDKVFIDLKSYHEIIKLTLEFNRVSFLALKLFALTKELRHKFITKRKTFQCIGLRKFPINTKEMQLQENCIELRE